MKNLQGKNCLGYFFKHIVLKAVDYDLKIPFSFIPNTAETAFMV
jgi:hypothetical protein